MSEAVIHYHEVALKGRNRRRFEDRLVENIRLALKAFPATRVRREYGRIAVETGGDAGEVAGALRRVYGIANFTWGERTGPDLEKVAEAAVALARQRAFDTFAVRARRRRDLDIPSVEINRFVGARVVSATGARVDLDNPALTIFIEANQTGAFVGAGKIRGPGGLPVGTSARAVLLLSGGLDSPVAGHLIMKRGAPITALHFHSAPFTPPASIEKARDLGRHLSRGQPGFHLYAAPLGPIQRAVCEAAPSRYRVLLYRRFMLRIAEEVAIRERAPACVTGDSLGQVASQTLENMAAVQAAVRLPVIRPLIGLDKEEIVSMARAIGTYDISIRPHDDCCSYLLPHDPATRSVPADLDEAERDLDVAALVAEALEGLEPLPL